MSNIIQIVIGIVIGLISLSLMMLLHELGHYVAGRLLGFKVVEFSIFMGPRIFSWVKNDIRYSIKCLPIGASVEFMGEFPNMDDKLNPNSIGTKRDELIQEEPLLSDAEMFERDRAAGIFYAQAKWKRFIVMAAGPAMNLLTGFLAFWLYFACIGSGTNILVTPPPYSLAATHEIQTGDKIISYNGINIQTDMDMLVASRLPANNPEKGRELTYLSKSDNNVKTVYLKPEIRKFLRLNITVSEKDHQFTVIDSKNPDLKVGDQLLKINDKIFDGRPVLYTGDAAENTEVQALVEILRDGNNLTIPVKQTIQFTQADPGIYLAATTGIGAAFKYAYHYSISVVTGSWRLLGLLFHGGLKASDALAGPVGIVNIYSAITASSFVWTEKLLKFLQVFALISISLGICNFLPIPPLDGSQIFLLAIEAVRGKRLSQKAENIYGYIGLVLVLGLAILTFWVDIMRIFGY